MWTGTVGSSELFQANRWTVAYFAKGSPVMSAGFPTRPLREVVQERRGATDPQDLGEELINYLGLENIRPQTGELVDFAPRKAMTVKSRSKIFRRGDVLFGRLRPELNKVYIADGAVADGICSGEFIVLIAAEKFLVPRYLRHVLASRFVTQFARQLKSGAALPRMNVDDLLSIEIPIPPLPIQTRISQQLEAYDEELAALRERLDALPLSVTNALVEALEQGHPVLKIAS